VKKPPFTKIIMSAMIACNVAVIIFTCVMVWRTGDTSPLGWLLVGEGGPLATWLAGYAWKEKAANKSKYAFLFIKEFAAEHGVDRAIQIAQLVLQE